ncbi:unnamed protein product, partial [Prorocentrum cordatum]
MSLVVMIINAISLFVILQMSLLSAQLSLIVLMKNCIVALMGVLLLLLAPNVIFRAYYRLKKLYTSLLHVQVDCGYLARRTCRCLSLLPVSILRLVKLAMELLTKA